MQKSTSQEKQHHDPLLVLLGAGAVLGSVAAPYVKRVIERSRPFVENAYAKSQDQVQKFESLVSEMRDYYKSTDGARRPKVAKTKTTRS